MFTLKIENENGDRLELTHNPNYNVKVTGLEPVKADITTAKVANRNGVRYVSSRKQPRNVVITVYINEPVEANRIELYKYVKSKEWLRIYFKNKSRDVYVDGYVESFECDLFKQTQTAQISVICPNPQLIDVESNVEDISTIKPMFSFPFYATIPDDNLIEYYSPIVAQGIPIKAYVNERGSLYVSGVFGSEGYVESVDLSSQTMGAGEYVLSGVPEGETRYALIAKVNGVEYVDTGNGVRFTLTELTTVMCSIKFIETEYYTLNVNVRLARYLDFDEDKSIIFGAYDKLARLVYNGSDDDIGFIYKIHCKGLVANPTIYSEDTKEQFKLNGNYIEDSIITINTNDGQKGVTREYKGVVTNIINDLDATSKWLKLKSGYNHILQTAELGTENMVSEIIYSKEYEGV